MSSWMTGRPPWSAMVAVLGLTLGAGLAAAGCGTTEAAPTTGVEVSGEGRLVLATQQDRDLRGEAAEHDVGRVDDVPAPLDVGGDYACAEWSVTMTHTGPLVLAGGEVVEPTGTRIMVNGATVAEFRGDRICSLRQYWDELAVFEQIGLVGGDDG